VPTSHPRTSSGTEFVDTLVGSPSFGVVGDGIRAAFAASGPAHEAGASAPDAPVLVCLLAHHLGRSTLHEPRLLRNRHRAFLVGWEIEELTDLLREELAAADVLLGISDFNTAVFARHFPDVPAITVPVCPPFPPRPEPSRERWGIPEDVTVFLNVFNPVSGFDRKNPIDVHEAFLQAFPDRDDVRLVFKAHGGFAKQPDEGDLVGEEQRAASFVERCAADDRVILIDEFLSYDDVVALVASCDAYVSLARAEGLGLPVLEAMALGVPTICMDYSGHSDFVTAEGSLLVPYDLIDVPEDASHYYNPRSYSSEPPRWAQPRLPEAAALMRELADDAALRERLSHGALIGASEHQQRCADSHWLADLEEALASPGVIARHAMKEQTFQRVASGDREMWLDHERRVRSARRSLAVRTRLGRFKRRLLGLVRPRPRQNT
jgi:glycosyltransferase involved in cell wall biosynthesis